MRKEKGRLKRILANLLVFALVFQMAVPVGAVTAVEEVSVAEAVEDMSQEVVSAVEETKAAQMPDVAAEEEILPETAAGDFVIEDGVLVSYTGTEEHVVIPDGVTKVAKNAFSDNDTLKTVTFPDSVRTIITGALINCANLEKVTLPNTAVEFSGGDDYPMYSDALVKCGSGDKPVEVVIPEKLTTECLHYNFLSGKYSTTTYFFNVSPDNERYSSDQYGMLYEEAKITLEDGTEEEGLRLLSINQSPMDYYEMPKNLIAIECNGSDEPISNIKTLKLSGNIGVLDYNNKIYNTSSPAFANLEKVIIPTGLTYLESGMYNFASAFQGVTTFEVEAGHEYFTVEDGVLYSKDKKVLYYYPTTKTDLKEFYVPRTVETIGSNAFYSVKGLDIFLPEGLKKIEENAFYICTGGSYNLQEGEEVYIHTNGSKPEINKYACRFVTAIYVDKTLDNESEIIWLQYDENIGTNISYGVETIVKSDLVTLISPNYVDGSALQLAGWGYSDENEDVVIYCNGELLTQTTPNPITPDEINRWLATVQLPITEETPNGTAFEVYAQIGDSTSKKVTVIYQKTKFPEVTKANISHWQDYPIDLRKYVSNVIVFVGLPTFQVELDIENTENMSNCVCLTDEDKAYAVIKDEESGKWIAQIPAEERPNELRLRCVVTTETGEITYEFCPISLMWIIDPSGYIYEAVPENRIEGATMSIYSKENENAPDTEKEFWDATPYYQSNPIQTDVNGRYAWDVPEGWWQVVAEKDGYVTAKSDWLPVPPPQLDVNLELVSTQAPSVAAVELSSSKMKVTFSKYVKAASVVDRISLSAAGTDVAIKGITALNAAKRNDEEIATAFEVTFENALDASKTYTAAFAAGIESYAGTAMDAAEVTDLKVTGIVSGLEIQDVMLLERGKEYTYKVTVKADQNLAGRKVSVVSADASVVSVTESAMTDENGKASIVVKGLGIGSTQLTFAVEGTAVSKKVTATVVYDTALKDELKESLDVKIPGEDVYEEDIKDPVAPETPSVSENTTPVDLAKATVATIANQVYTGSALTPAVTVTVDGKTLVKDTDYTVAYANNTDAGTAQVTITGKGNYTGTKTVTFTIDKAASKLKASKATYKKAYGAKAFTVKVTGAEGTVSYKSSSTKVAKVSKSGKVTIKNTGRAVITASVKESKNYKAGSVKIVIEVSPKKATIKTLASKKAKQLTVTWKKDTKASGYEISYSTSKKFKKSQTKKVLVKKNKTTKTTIKKLKKGKTYYVKVRAYKEVKVNGKKVKIYSPYSKVLKKKVK